MVNTVFRIPGAEEGKKIAVIAVILDLKLY